MTEFCYITSAGEVVPITIDHCSDANCGCGRNFMAAVETETKRQVMLCQSIVFPYRAGMSHEVGSA